MRFAAAGPRVQPKVTRRSARWVWRSIAVAVAASAALDGVAEWQIRRRRDDWARESAKDRIRAASYRRPITYGEPLDQNAADWYRKALAPVREPSPKTLEQLRELLDSGPGQNASMAFDIDAVCPTAEAIAHVSQALRCNYCDWHLDYEMGPSALFEPGSRAVALADCLTLRGYRAASAGSYGSAAESYLEVVAFGCDFGAGNLVMNGVAITVTKEALTALRRLLTTIEYDPILFADVAERLTKLQSCLPTGQNAVHLDRLQATHALIADALTSATWRERVLNPSFVPWRVVAAWRLTQDLSLVNDVADSAAIRDPGERAHFVNGLQRRSRTSNLFAKEVVKADWLGVIDAANELARDSHAALAVIDIEQWYQRYGRYPDGRAEVPALLTEDRVRYECNRDGRGYSLLGTSAAGTPQSLAHHSR